MTAKAPGRAFARYVSDDPTRVSLPGYLAADPGEVVPGDVFGYDDAFSEELDASTLFEAADAPEVVSPNESLTKAQLAERLSTDDDQVDPDAFTKPDLVALADAHDQLNPEPPGNPDRDDTEEGTPR